MNCELPYETTGWDELDPFWEYELERIVWMAEAFQAVLSEFQWKIDQYAETIKRTREEQSSWINAIAGKLDEIQEIVDRKAKVLQCEIS